MSKLIGIVLAHSLLGTTVAIPAVASAASESVIYSFQGSPDGAFPQAGLTEVGGILYGTTQSGGIGQSCYTAPTCGTAFSITPSGTETVLYSFATQYNEDAAFPHAALINVQGTLYSTAWGGFGYPVHSGDGTLYSLTPAGAEAVLFRFPDDKNGLAFPNGVLKVGQNFYGTTRFGGLNSQGYAAGGTVVSITPSGVLTVIYVFKGDRSNDGQDPSSAMIDVDRKFYGTTLFGSAHVGDTGCGGFGCGTLFSVTPAGAETIVYTFGRGTNDGAIPQGDIIYFGGKFYGTTSQGGGKGCGGAGCGTVYSITPDGTETVLHAFKGGRDGATPEAGLIAVGGKLYGTTAAGGTYGYGTVFRITTAGAEKVLHAFGDGSDGRTPLAGLLDVGGVLYGTTNSGGANSVGTVFKIVR